MKAALEYLKKKHGITVTAQTIRNWMSKGRAGLVLDSRDPEILDAWVEHFGTEAFVRGRPTGPGGQ